jgi:ADP-heptose:LPS heptosyltransferase
MQKIIGLWLTHGLGDVAMSIPVINDVADNKKNIVHVYVMSELVVSFVEKILKRDNVLCFSIKNNATFKVLLFNKYDEFYFIHGEKKIKHLALYLFVRSKVKVIPITENYIFDYIFTKKVYSDEVEHKVNYYRRYVGLPVIHEYSEKFRRDKKSKNYFSIVIAPGSYEKETHKRWPSILWAKLIDEIYHNYEDEIKISIIGSVAENYLIMDIVNNAQTKDKIYIDQVKTIEDTLSSLSESDLVISVCNAMSHIASILKIPVLGIYGPTNPEYTGVFSSNCRIVKSEIDCAPCYSSKNTSGCGDNICMSSIAYENVYNVFSRYYADLNEKCGYK